MFANIVKVFAALFLFKFGAAFRPSFPKRSPQTSLFMGTFGVQKLGQSIIDTVIPSKIPTDSAELFKRASVGSGSDYRKTSTEQEDEKDFKVLSKIGKSMKQRTLLMSLESKSVGAVEKIERIRFATLGEGLLPASVSFSSSTVHASSLLAGGLMSEWEM